MIRTGDEYRESIRDGREVWINGERVDDVPTHPAFKPIVDIRARIYDMAHDPATREVMTYRGGRRAQRRRPQAAAHARGLAGQAPRRRRRARRHRRRRHPRRRRDRRRDVVAARRPGRPGRGRPALLGQHPPPHPARGPRRSVPCLGQHRPQGRPLQAPAGPGPRHAAACRQGDRRRHRRARRQVRDRRRLRQPGLRRSRRSPTGATPSCRTTPSASSPTWARRASSTSAAPASPGRAPAEDYPLSNRFDEVDTLLVFDDVEIPWENVLFYRHTPRRRLHPRDAAPLQRLPFVQRCCGSPTC